MNKHPALIEAVAALRQRLGPDAFKITDYWDADLLAIGLSSPADPRLIYLALVAEWRDDNEQLEIVDSRFFISLERAAPEGTKIPFEGSGEFEDLDFEDVVMIARRHLRAK